MRALATVATFGLIYCGGIIAGHGAPLWQILLLMVPGAILNGIAWGLARW